MVELLPPAAATGPPRPPSKVRPRPGPPLPISRPGVLYCRGGGVGEVEVGRLIGSRSSCEEAADSKVLLLLGDDAKAENVLSSQRK